MPKIVDHEERRADIADALWAVVRREGYAAVSVRSVAAETGRSTGSLRHYFSTQAELTAFAMTSLVERVQVRVQEAVRAAGTAPDLEALARVIDEVLPLDAQRHAESEVWLAMVAAARTDEVLHGLSVQAHRGLRSLCEGVVRAVLGPTAPEEHIRDRTDQLHGLVDGLAVHGTFHPHLMPRTRVRAAVRSHLHELGSSRE